MKIIFFILIASFIYFSAFAEKNKVPKFPGSIVKNEFLFNPAGSSQLNSLLDEKRLELKSAKATVDKDRVFVTTGTATFEWQISENGMLMTSLSPGKENLADPVNTVPAWNFGETDTGYILSNVVLEKSDDQGFTSPHIRVALDFDSKGIAPDVRYEVWVYPGAPGIRTQIFLKQGERSSKAPEEPVTVEAISFAKKISDINAIGYYNDTQHRNKKGTPILKNELYCNVDNPDINWANLVALNQDNNKVILVKESHKCVNQQAVHTGGFRFGGPIVSVYGSGLEGEALTGTFQPCWATWIILSKDGEDEMQLALKQFDRIRYPINKEKDMYIMANTWGSGDAGVNSKYASREENILNEIASVADLGIDVLQIDDGWQGPDYDSWEPVDSMEYLNANPEIIQELPDKTKYAVYPGGWKNVRSKANDLGIKLALWAASRIPYDDLARNYLNGGFKYYKLDFARLNTYPEFQGLVNKTRKFILATSHDTRINWDVTENHIRMGYYYGREYGNIYLENRKPLNPPNVVYKPWLVLRDAWHAAHYLNLNKFQISYQNVDMVDRNRSNAYLHSHDYCLAITLMGAPLFFQETHLLRESARNEVRSLLEVYKTHRSAVYDAYVFAIGDEPTNASWSGFQAHNLETGAGFLTIFRELNNPEPTKTMKLKFIGNKKLKLTDLITGEEKLVGSVDGRITFNIEKAAGFKYLKYEIYNYKF